MASELDILYAVTAACVRSPYKTRLMCMTDSTVQHRMLTIERLLENPTENFHQLLRVICATVRDVQEHAADITDSAAVFEKLKRLAVMIAETA